MDDTSLHTADMVDEAEIQSIYGYFLGRRPNPDTVPALLERKMTVGQLETSLM